VWKKCGKIFNFSPAWGCLFGRLFLLQFTMFAAKSLFIALILTKVLFNRSSAIKETIDPVNSFWASFEQFSVLISLGALIAKISYEG
jgi:hypothetical protein